MKRFCLGWALLSALVGLSGAAPAQELAELPAVTESTLNSGLRVVLQPSPGAPEVTVCTSVEAGPARDPGEAPGAHRLLADMLRAGGYRSPRGQYDELVVSRGAESELFVSRDLVTFCTTTPAAELPLSLWVSAGRFARANLAEAAREQAIERLAAVTERQEEDVMGGRAAERLRQMVFLGAPALAHPELPNASELDGLDLGLLRTLHGTGYVARRAVLSISGGFEPIAARELLEQQLAQVPSGEAAARLRAALVPQSTARFSMAEDPRVKAPAVWYGWLSPGGRTGRLLELALSALTAPARLGAKLLGEGGAAKELTLSAEGAPGPGLLRLRALGTGGQSLGTIERHLDEGLKALATQALGPEEIAQGLAALRASERRQLLTAPTLARVLSEGVLRGQTPVELLATLSGPPSEYSGEEVRLAVLEYLAPERRSSVEIYPKGWQDPWQTPMPVYHIVSSGETLTSIARASRSTVAIITKMNGMTEKQRIYPGDKLKVPRGAQKPEAKVRTHVVRRGDTLSALAQKYGVSARAIAEDNGMSAKQPILAGETLRIPLANKDDKSGAAEGSGDAHGPSSSKGSGGTRQHEVKSGETLGGIAHKYGVPLAAVAKQNGLTSKSMVRVGQLLTIPSAAPAEGAEARAPSVYSVAPGDTLSGIARKHGVTVTELERLNGISRKGTLRLGQTLTLPSKK